MIFPVEQEVLETLIFIGLYYDGVGLTVQVWRYWALGDEPFSWGS